MKKKKQSVIVETELPSVASAHFYLSVQRDPKRKKYVQIRVAAPAPVSSTGVANLYGGKFDEASLRVLGRVLDACYEYGQKNFAGVIRNLLMIR